VVVSLFVADVSDDADDDDADVLWDDVTVMLQRVYVCTESEWVGAASRHQSSSYPLTALHCHRDAHDLIAAHHCQSLQLAAAAAVSCLSVNVLARILCVASRCKMSLNWTELNRYRSVTICQYAIPNFCRLARAGF